MVTKTQARRKQDIKSKLMAAIAMLLVSSIMMVSSTYAWFTLSTAPEVTGISTAVGANGNLEMALLPTHGDATLIESGVGDSMAVDTAFNANTTWGNLVDLSPVEEIDLYGLTEITLYPSAVNIGQDGKLVTGSLLKTPTYGSDGRVDALLANTTTSTYKGNAGFLPEAEGTNDFGVRAVGVVSGMTERQLDYRNARSAANTAASLAKNTASNSLSTNGSALANIAIKKGTNEAPTFTQTDVDALNAIVDDLLGTDTKKGALEYIEEAYMQYLLAIAASAKSGTEDTAWQAVKGAINAEGATLATVMAAFTDEEENSILPTELTTAIAAFNDFTEEETPDSTVEKVEAADTALEALTADENGNYSWAQLSPILHYLANPETMKVNGYAANVIKDNMSALVNSVTNGGLVVTMETGGGVYVDIADHCGDYSASVKINEVTYGGVTLNGVNARMETKSNKGTGSAYYLNVISAAFNNAETGLVAPSSGSEARPISDMYGYVIDLAFRTNAAESNLLLQKTAKDRIYDGNTNEETMGHGATMTFASTTTDFDNDDIKRLMDAIRIIFFNPDDGTIYVKGKLNTTGATIGADGVTATIGLYKGTLGSNEVSYVPVSGAEVGTHKQVITYTAIPDLANWTGKIYSKAEGSETYTEINKTDIVEGQTYYSQSITYTTLSDEEKSDSTITKYKEVTGEDDAGDVIMPLTQNTAHKLSVLVYLDGEIVGNDDVAATASTSVKGTMNLQFASSATLVPMDYADLNTPAETTDDETQNP